MPGLPSSFADEPASDTPPTRPREPYAADTATVKKPQRDGNAITRESEPAPTELIMAAKVARQGYVTNAQPWPTIPVAMGTMQLPFPGALPHGGNPYPGQYPAQYGSPQPQNPDQLPGSGTTRPGAPTAAQTRMGAVPMGMSMPMMQPAPQPWMPMAQVPSAAPTVAVPRQNGASGSLKPRDMAVFVIGTVFGLLFALAVFLGASHGTAADSAPAAQPAPTVRELAPVSTTPASTTPAVAVAPPSAVPSPAVVVAPPPPTRDLGDVSVSPSQLPAAPSSARPAPKREAREGRVASPPSRPAAPPPAADPPEPKGTKGGGGGGDITDMLGAGLRP